MARRYTPPRFLRVALPARAAVALALSLVACQSDDAGGGAEAEPEERANTSDTVTPVPGRSTEANGNASDDGAEPATAPASTEPQAAETDTSEAPAAAQASEDPVAPAQAFSACTTDGGPYSDCETIYVTVTQASPARCIQLTIDNCGTYGRQGLAADTPATWRLAGGSVGSDADPCELGAFYPGNPSIANATGEVTWDETTPRPTALALDLTLELSAAAGAAEPITLATSTPLDPTECDE